MGKIVISENVTIDGGVQDPMGDEGLSFGGWFSRLSSKDREEWSKVALKEAQQAEVLLLGRRSYEFLASRWPARTGPFADRLNSMRKCVVSTTLEAPAWKNTTVLKRDVVTALAKLRQELSGDIVVNASFGLVPMLFEHDLVDELRLMICPSLLGGGRRLFDGVREMNSLGLVQVERVGTSLALLTYQPVRVA